MKLFFITAFVFISITTTAQNKMVFSSQNYIGLLEGEYGSKFQLQTINGLKYKTWFVGLGTGIDWYYRRSIPAFVSFSKDFFKNGNRNFYVSAAGGLNFPWKDDNNYNEWGYNVEKSHSGFYYEAGFGYKIGIGKKNDALLIQLGYSYKHISENAKNFNYYMVNMTPGSQQYDFTNRFDYRLRRLSLKLGWSF
jgi:hypothetical protein